MRRGVLPPEVSVLYGIGLVHLGGMNFVAKKCMEAIDQLEQESKSWLAETSTETSLAATAEWHFCKTSATESLGRTSAYAFVADILNNTPKEAEWAPYLVPFFQRQIQILKDSGLTDALVDPNVGHSLQSKYRVQQVLKSVHSWARIEVVCATKAYREALRSGGPEDGRSSKQSVINVFIWMRSLLHITSSQTLLVEDDGSISTDCMEVRKS